MGRKSKGTKKAATGPTISKIEKYEDTLEEGGVDDYIFKRDQINFADAPADDDEDINDGQGEEVLGLSWKRAGDDDEEAEEFEEEEEAWGAPKERKVKAKADLSTKGRFGKEEVSSDEYSSDEGSGSGSDEDEEGWGRQYYSRPSTRREREKEDEYDEKREEERDMEEREVRRLQRRARESLAEDDWGLDDVAVEYTLPEKAEAVAVAVSAPVTDDPEVLVRHLQAHEPLKLALARDFPLVLRKLRSTAKGIKRMSKEREGEESLHKGLGWLHYQALLTYATTLAFYIHLCALPAAERPDMSAHPILQRLLQLKEGVATLEDLDFSAGSVSDAGPELFVPDGMELEDEDEDEDEDEFEAMLAAKRELMGRMQEGAGMQPDDDDDMDDEEEIDDDDDMAHIWKADAEAEDIAFDDSELADLIADAERGAAKADSKEKKKRGKKAKKSKAAKAEAKADSDSDDAVAFTPMAEPEFVSTKKSKSKKSLALSDADAMLGDSIELADADAGDKDRRKKTLRFHTAKIAATSARRSAARDKRLGGDDDIPYRDRQAARDAALRKNGPRGTEGEDLDGSEWTDSDRKRAREVRDEADADAGDADADDGYYDLVKRRKVAKDEEKAAKHDEFLEDKFASFADLDESTDGPRALTRAIEKNRGLTPRRAKTGRNPRVKKKLAYEKAKQKVGSQRAVFKGGQSAQSGAYAGEKTGISTVSKSRKF